jgi:DNA-directed RNA polymerase subunit RPC12/RpoP
MQMTLAGFGYMKPPDRKSIMNINNPLSKTHFKITSDRLQHYTNDKYRCSDCGHQYHPKVHSQPYVIQLGLFVVGIAVYILFIKQASLWLSALILTLILAFFLWYHHKDRQVKTADGTQKVKYGDIVIECPECGSQEARMII